MKLGEKCRLSVLSILLLFFFQGCSHEFDNPADSDRKESLPTEGLVAWYPFNGNANDESGNLFHGSIYGAVLAKDRHANSNRSLYFNGTSSYVEIPTNNSINFSTTFSMTMWIKTALINTNSGRYPNIVAKYSPYNDRSGYGICMGPANNYRIYFELFSHNSQSDIGTSYAINDNRWHFLAAIRDGTAQYFYVDNTLIGSQSFSGGTSNNYSLFIGGLPLFSYDNFYFEGSIDDVRFYNRAITAAEVKLLFSE